MALRSGALYDALIIAKVPEAQARTAAEEVANYDARMHSLERDLTLLKWMISANLALTIAVLGRLLFIR